MHAPNLVLQAFHLGQVVEGLDGAEHDAVAVAHQRGAEAEGDGALVDAPQVFLLIHQAVAGLQRVQHGLVAAAIDAHHLLVGATEDLLLATPRDLLGRLVEQIDAAVETDHEETVRHAFEDVVEIVGDPVLLFEAVAQVAVRLLEAHVEELELLLQLLVGLHVAPCGLVEQGVRVGEGLLEGDFGLPPDLQHVVGSGFGR